MYSVIFGDPAISPTPKINIDAIIKNGLFVNNVSDIPIEQTKKPVIIEVSGFHFIIIVETTIWNIIIYIASMFVMYSAAIVPSSDPIFSISQGQTFQ